MEIRINNPPPYLVKRWDMTLDIPYMTYYVVDFLVALHEREHIPFNHGLLARNSLSIIDAILHGHVKDADIDYTVSGIAAIKRCKLNNQGHVIFE